MATDPTADKLRKVYLEIFKTQFPQLSDSEITQLEYGQNLDWDSLAHLRIISELDSKLGVILSLKQMIEFKSFEKGLWIILDAKKIKTL